MYSSVLVNGFASDPIALQQGRGGGGGIRAVLSPLLYVLSLEPYLKFVLVMVSVYLALLLFLNLRMQTTLLVHLVPENLFYLFLIYVIILILPLAQS